MRALQPAHRKVVRISFRVLIRFAIDNIICFADFQSSRGNNSSYFIFTFTGTFVSSTVMLPLNEEISIH